MRGVADVSPASGMRVVCYCDDCQAFAHFLERDDVLDAHGGTDIFQMAPARMRITEGAAELRSMRLSDKGLYRWYAGCCKTPIGNTLSPQFPFVGTVHVFMDHAGDGRSRDDVLGAPVARIHGREAPGGSAPGAHPSMPVRALLRMVRSLAGWKLGGGGWPSPFFDRDTKAPRVAPRVLTAPEREALRRK
jgi:Family of unknown function (DUF6151)